MIQTLNVETIHINAQNLKAMAEFYQSIVGMKEIDRDEHSVSLGTGGNILLVIHQATEEDGRNRSSGLFHMALLLSKEEDLARWLHGYIALPHEKQRYLTGASDHGVSKALYLDDPEGNGIEIYIDRVEAEWPRDADGHINMFTAQLDIERLLSKAPGTPSLELPGDTIIGHVHLKVADINDSKDFYVDRLGLDLVQNYGGSALFVSTGGYHHQIGLNVWASRGQEAVPHGAPGLEAVDLKVEAGNEDGKWNPIQLMSYMRDNKINATQLENGAVSCTDPSGIRLNFSVCVGATIG